MPKVTRITVQKHNKNRYNVFVNSSGQEQYGFSVEEETLIKEGLKKGQELDQTTIDALLQADTLYKGYSQALTYLGHRMRSIKEMRDYLIKKEIDQDQIDAIINRLESEKLLDDQAFAKAYVSTKKNTTLKGPQRIQLELKEKGVHQSEIDQALLVFTTEEQIERVRQWLMKQANKSSRYSYKQVLLKQKQTLVQKGFDSTIINQAFQLLEQPKDNEQEWQAVLYQGEKLKRRQAKKYSGYMLKQKIKAALYQKGFDTEVIDRYLDMHLDDE
ncbi:recombination regulator RecX [Amphibacillus cookii]|uniref:recombination regulator RecX n=1 Tax=Amphibacillus cookii TaxID=767787 RepID=UPI0019577F21|nr:recombination regulator RecX [Amphibacillus cookii]MBM7542148.1 regulatory protein [Amphibacillus cookii]